MWAVCFPRPHSDQRKERMKRTLTLLAIAASLMGCATVPPLNTSSGRPEVTICGVSKSELMEKVVARATMGGQNIRSTSNYQIVMGKPVTNLLAAALMGSKYDSTPEYRLVWTFANLGNNCTYVGVTVQIVTNPGSAFERITDVSSGKDAHQIQASLEEFKARMEGRSSATKEPDIQWLEDAPAKPAKQSPAPNLK